MCAAALAGLNAYHDRKRHALAGSAVAHPDVAWVWWVVKRVGIRTVVKCFTAGCIAVVWFCTALLAARMMHLVVPGEPVARMLSGS